MKSDKQMLAVPTAVDEANAAKYYAGVSRVGKLLRDNKLGLPIRVQSRALTNDDLPGIYEPEKLDTLDSAEWSGSCDSISCFPFTMNGDMCKPTDKPQTWQAPDGSVYTGCQESCYGSFPYNLDDPKPSGLPLRGAVVDGKHECILRDVGKMLWFGIPAARGNGTVDGLTNVPPMVVGDDDSITIPKTYCDWFGMSYDSNGCYRPWYQLILEDYLIGQTMYRVFTVDRGGAPSNSYLHIINSDEYHRTYQQLASAWARHDETFVPYRNTQYMFDRPPPSFSNWLPSDSEIVRRVPRANEPFDFEDVWDGLGDNIILSLLRDVLIDVSTDKLLEVAQAYVKQLAKFLESALQESIEKLFLVGGKSLMTSAIRSSIGGLVLRAVGNFGVRGLQLLASAFTSAVATFNVVQLSLGIAGLVLDLFDPLSLSSYLDDSTVQLYIDQFNATYIENFHTSALQVRAVDLLSMADTATEDDVFIDAIVAQSIYLSQLQYNSIGQRLDWSTDSDPGEPHNQERTPTINSILYQTNNWDVAQYNYRQKVFIENEKDLPRRLGTGVAIITSVAALLSFAVIRHISWPLILAIILLLVWLGYQIFIVARKTRLQTLMYRINMELIKGKLLHKPDSVDE